MKQLATREASHYPRLYLHHIRRNLPLFPSYTNAMRPIVKLYCMEKQKGRDAHRRKTSTATNKMKRKLPEDGIMDQNSADVEAGTPEKAKKHSRAAL